MLRFACPVCHAPLWDMGQMLKCPQGHSFDKNKKGYVNLALSAASGKKRHGDDKTMVISRREFLEKGFYSPLRDEICRQAEPVSKDRVGLLDAGCGEGWYTCALKAALEAEGKLCSAVGVDISKNALMFAGRRDPEISWAVASVASLPVEDGSCDLLVSVFAPNDDAEFRRVLRPGGLLMKVMPRENHLLGLKRAVYDKPYVNPPAVYEPEGFELVELSAPGQMIHLSCGEDIRNLFMMTPYYYKTGREDQAKLDRLESLDTEAEFAIALLRRI